METRNTLGLGKRPDKASDTPTGPQFKITLTGPAKGMAPVTIIVPASSGKAACAGLRALFINGKLKVEQA
jgi:hypothetical protein